MSDSKKIYGVRASRNNLSNLRYWENMVLQEMPNPDIVLQSVGRRIERYRDLLYDAHVSSCVQSRKSGVLSLEWEINRGAMKSPEALFIENIFKNLDIPKIIQDILDAVFFGYAFLEVYWLPLKGRIVPVDVVGKPQEWFFFNHNNEPRFRKEILKREGEPLGTKKFFVVQHNPTYTNPYGEAILSKCYWPVFYKKETIKKWMSFSEKFGQPIVDVSAANLDSDAMVKLQNEIVNMADDSIFVHPEDVAMKFTEAARLSTVAIYKDAINMFNTEVSKAVLSQTLTTEQGDTGSYAMSQTHFQIRGDVVDTDKRIVEQHFNDLIKWIVELNFGSLPVIPKFEMYEETQVDLTLSQRDVNLYQQIKFTKVYYNRWYGLKDDEFEIAETQPSTPAFLSAFAEDDPSELNDVEKIDNIGIDDFITTPKEIVDKIVNLIENSNSFEDIEKKIVKLYPELNTQDMEKAMADAINKAQAIGLFAAQKGSVFNEAKQIVKKLFTRFTRK